jgi:DNA-directed RNA polymerase specialized sigma24 family protein
MAVLSQLDTGYEDFVREHSREFSRYLTRLLGRAREGAGGRVEVIDTLQEAMLRIAKEWPELAQIADDERDRRLYRCLRDAAGQALRHEYGRVGARHQRPRLAAYDFRELEIDGEDLDPREQELTAAVLGVMAREIADLKERTERRAILSRAVLLAGLRALDEREAVALIAVDHLGWDQRELADHLSVDFGQLRGALFSARKVFYGVVRHAIGLELDEEERATLHAYLAGELSGREKRLARRHLQHCGACRAFVREQRLFGEQAQRVLAPLPYVLGGTALARSSTKKSVVVGASASASGKGLLGQAGAAKALAVTVGVLGVGVGVTGWLAERDARDHATPPTAGASIDVPTRLGDLPTRLRTITTASVRSSQRRSKKAKHGSRRTGRAQSKLTPPASVSTQSQAGAAPPPPPPATGRSSADGSGGGEFFNGGA